MLIVALLATWSAPALAYVDPACVGETQLEDDAGQTSFMLNYFALSTSFSALHGPVSAPAGHGDLGVELAIIPPLSCARRLVLDSSKTEDTNKAPAAPRLRAHFSLPEVGPVRLYAGLGYIPPLTVFGTRNHIVSLEAGGGVALESGLQLGLRYHATVMKTVAELATPFVEGEPAVNDFYSAGTLGFDLMGGLDAGRFTPYLALGLADASTYFWIGDDGFIGNNTRPFFGPTGSLGSEVRLWEDRLLVAGEVYSAPGLTWTAPGLNEDAALPEGWEFIPRGLITTGRLRAALRI